MASLGWAGCQPQAPLLQVQVCAALGQDDTATSGFVRLCPGRVCDVCVVVAWFVQLVQPEWVGWELVVLAALLVHPNVQGADAMGGHSCIATT